MPHFWINQRYFPQAKCAAYSETVCGMLRLSVRLTPFNCAACSVFCIYAYRDSLFEGTPAPFMFVHRILSAKLRDFSEWVEHVRSDKPSADIFGKSNRCAEWRKVG